MFPRLLSCTELFFFETISYRMYFVEFEVILLSF